MRAIAYHKDGEISLIGINEPCLEISETRLITGAETRERPLFLRLLT